jgi:zinc protease
MWFSGQAISGAAAQWQGGKTGGVHAPVAGLYTPRKSCILPVMRFAPLLSALFVFLSLIGPVWAQAKIALEGPKVEEFTLENGMRFLLIPDPQSTSVIHSLWYKAGSADEPKGKSGLAHFLEHLMYKGTRKNPPGVYGDAVASDGAQYNAFTWMDYTVYHVRVPKPLLSRVMELEADRMRGLLLDPEPMETERQVIKEERRERHESRPEQLLVERMDSVLLKDTPYEKPVSGYQTEIDKLSIADVQAFYDAHYHPQNAFAIVAGNLDLDELKAFASQYFDEVPRGSERKRDVSSQLPAEPQEKLIEMESDAAPQTLVMMSFATPGFDASQKPEVFALDILGNILASGTQGRLVERLVLQDKSALDADVDFDALRLHGAQLTIRVPLNRGANPADVRKAIAEEIDRIAQQGVKDDEIKAAIRRSEISAIYAWDSQSAIVNWLGAKASLDLPVSEAFSMKRWESVTAAQVQAAAKQFLAPNRALTGVLLSKQGSN